MAGGKPKLTAHDVAEMRGARRMQYVSDRELADHFGVHTRTIHSALRGDTWKSVDAIIAPLEPTDANHVRGERSRQTSLNAEQVRKIRRLHAEGDSYTTIARRFEITRSSVQKIVTRRNWAHVD